MFRPGAVSERPGQPSGPLLQNAKTASSSWDGVTMMVLFYRFGPEALAHGCPGTLSQIPGFFRL